MINVKNKRPTIRDVAREAGVSYQTVSRVLNNQPKVSPETRARVLGSMEKLRYQRNVAAQMLNTQRSQTIQVVAIDTKFPISIHALAQSAKEEGYLILYVECTEETLAQTFDMAASRMMDGLYLYAPKLRIDDDDLVVMTHDIPFVRRDYAVDSRLTWVGFDQPGAAQMLVKYLIDLGHRDIAEVTGSMELINPYYRHRGYRAALEAYGLEPGPSVIGDYSTVEMAMQTGYEGTCQIIRSGAKFTALMLANDFMTVGALHALREYNLRVPEDVSVVSFDNAPHAQYMAPPLTVVNFEFQRQDDLAFHCLFERIANREAPHRQHILNPSLIVRQSTAPPAG